LDTAAQQLGMAAAVPACTLPTSAQTIKLRLLVISADGNEADLPAIKQALDFLGTPYDVYIASATPGGLTQSRLANGTLANYQGVILATGSLGYQSPSGWASALSAQEWNNLWSYSSTFCTRILSWYTYPTPDYGFNWPTGATGNPVAVTYTTGTTGGQGIFGGYATTTAPLTVQNAYVYQATPLADGNSTPLLKDASGNALAVLHTYATGRKSLALSFDSNASLVHTLALSYGLVNWVTQGTFLGERHIYLGGQVDDMYINDDHWLPSTACGTPIDQTGAEYRITGPDFKAVLNWQNAKQALPVTAGLRLSIAFNGEGSQPGYATPDTLTPEISADEFDFNWLSHTYDHPYLDGVTYAFAAAEIQQNNDVSNSIGFENNSAASMVTPSVSGLTTANFLQAAYDLGIRNLVTDTSVAGYNNPTPNAGIYNSYQPSILMLPRHPVNLYYNVAAPADWLAEDNCLYPAGANGHVATYQQLLDRESSVMLTYLLKGDIDPVMFHQTNMAAYDGTHTLLTDLLDATLAKYNALFTLPILSPKMDALGQLTRNRMQYNQSGAAALITRATTGLWTSITVSTQQAATVPVTGLNSTGAEIYGGQKIAHLALLAGGSATYPLP